MIYRLKAPAALASALALIAMVGCSSTSPSSTKTSPVSAPPPPRVEVLGTRLIDDASAYRAYMDQTKAISPGFSDGSAIASSLELGAAYEPTQLLRGAIAYGAIVALQDPTFVAGVRSYGSSATERRTMAYEIMRNPAYVMGLIGAPSAAGRVGQALGGEAQQLYDNGKAVKQAAYDVQKQDWSKAQVADREGRLARAKALSSTPLTGDLAETARLRQASMGAVSMGTSSASPAGAPYGAVVTRSLAIAALGILGEATAANQENLLAIMAEPNARFCLSMTKLNLYQCLAVAKPHYEDVFCLGQHAMMDTGRCLIKASGQVEPYEAKFVPVVNASHGYKVPKKASAKRGTKKR